MDSFPMLQRCFEGQWRGLSPETQIVAAPGLGYIRNIPDDLRIRWIPGGDPRDGGYDWIVTPLDTLTERTGRGDGTLAEDYSDVS